MSDNNKPKPSAPKPSSKDVEVEPIAIYDVILEDIVEPVTVPEVEEVKPVAVKASKAPASAPHVIGYEETDLVYLSRCVYKNKLDRKSLSVHHIQRRLLEWGYAEAYSDRDGYYADGTVASVAQFQEDHKLTRTDGHMDCDTLNALFENDQNVTVVCA